jgi:hypothetical protein
METNEPQKVLYRVECSSYEEVYTPTIEYIEYHIIKETKCGFWIFKYRKYGSKKFVLKNEHCSGKRFAYTTKEKALAAFICRRERYDDILSSQMTRNNKALFFARELFSKNDFESRTLGFDEAQSELGF